MGNEPVVSTALILAVVTAGLTALTAFGLDLSEGQSAAIVGFVSSVLILIGAVYARSKVSPVGKGA